jgi:hypothetical protein
MKRELIEDDEKAKAIADDYGCAESMIAQAEKQLPESIASGTGVVIAAKRSKPVPADGIKGPFEFVFICYFAGFIEGENGWSVVRWYDVGWEDMPQFVYEMNLTEKELLPKAVGTESAAKKMEEYRKFGGNPS